MPEVAVYTSNARGALETLKKSTNFANSQAMRRDAVHNHQLLVQGVIAFTQQAKRVSKGETGRSLEQTHLPAQDSSAPDTQTTMDPSGANKMECDTEGCKQKGTMRRQTRRRAC